MTPTRPSPSRLLADSGDAQYAVTERRLPPALFSRKDEAGDRYTQVESPYVDYVVPNFNSPVFKDANCREALKARDRPGRLDQGRWWRELLQGHRLGRQPERARLQVEPVVRRPPGLR
ncbi:hypothetical protein [Nocardioides convexus]|uniref:hypothetical protein n=1 Tax=Nocardioides convexus TaxID=2712224 RepID=UPI002418166B|nr:hypothetical protein [Nocardioides convexus]